MKDEERREIAEALTAAKSDMIDEILRQAELFLAEQLKAGLAADQRAMQMAVMLAAILAALVGGTASLVAAKISVWPHIISVGIMLPFLTVALIFAVMAAQPTTFCYAGSNPKHWVNDVRDGRSLARSKAEQAAFYAQNIADNKACLTLGHERLHRALNLSAIGVVSLVGSEFVVILATFNSIVAIWRT
jgi:hypothetical protein